MLTTLISLAVGVFLFCTLLVLFGPKTKKKDLVRDRLDDLGMDVHAAQLRDDELSKPFTERVVWPLIRQLTERLGTLIPSKGGSSAASENQKKMLMQAGWGISVEEYTVIQLICLICSGLLGLAFALFSRETVMNILLYTVGGMFAGYTILRYVCSAAATQRKKAMEEQLPDMLDLLSVSVAAGLGFERAILHITNTMEGPLIDEFTVTYREMSMGRSRKEALTLLGERCGIEDLTSVTSALVQAGQLGIPIRNVLQSQSAAIRRSRKSKVQEKAAKVSTKILLPMIAFIFPVLIIVLLGPSLITIMEEF